MDSPSSFPPLTTTLFLTVLSLLVAACSDGTVSDEADAGAFGADGSIRFDAASGADAGRDVTGPGDMCGDVRTIGSVYYGTPEPTALPLTQGQQYAVVAFGGCSGAFIADEWVLTANHCGVRVGRELCVGVEPRRPNVCFRADEVFDHPMGWDMTLIRVDAPASSRFPEMEPIPIMTTEIDDSWIGTIAEAAGYGTQEDGSSNEREFTAEPIDGFEARRGDGSQFVVINGMGERGVCFGDSGGPVMVQAADGTVRHLGVLSWGDPDCLGRDRYTRTDLSVDWIESHTGPTVIEGASCGDVSVEGECAGSAAVWCGDGDELQRERCEGACGWDDSASGWRCLAGPDPCEGVTPEGECQGEVAVWCDRGTLRRRDCGACGETCFPDQDSGLYYCGEDPCGGLDYLGECDGDVARWCDEGVVEERDCARQGLRCDYVNDRIGHFCTR